MQIVNINPMKQDLQIFNLIKKEEDRQTSGIELIASENYVSDQVLEALGSICTNKYAEGYPGARYYGGCEIVDQIEQLAIDRLCELFEAEYANVQPHSGAQANMAVMMSCTSIKEPVSTIDTALQTKVDSILRDKMNEINAVSGHAIVMEVQTGEIKAMVGEGKRQTSGLIRTASLLAALETGKVKLSDTVDVGEGVYMVHDEILKDHNWHRGGYGKITLKQGLACNSSIAVAKATQKAGVEAVDSLVTPLEMLKLFNSIIKNDSLKSALRYYITDGLGKQASSDKVEVAGFSGRSTISVDNSEKPEYAVEFIGYFPADAPKYSIIVSINKRGLPASGGLMAGSVFREIVDYLTDIDKK